MSHPSLRGEREQPCEPCADPGALPSTGPFPSVSPALSRTDLGTSRMEMPHILDVPGCGLPRASPFAESLSAEGRGMSVTASFVTAQLAPKSSLPQRRAVKTPVISQLVSPCAMARAWDTRSSPGTFGGVERSCHLAPVQGKMEQVEQEGVSGCLQPPEMVHGRRWGR